MEQCQADGPCGQTMALASLAPWANQESMLFEGLQGGKYGHSCVDPENDSIPVKNSRRLGPWPTDNHPFMVIL